MPQDFGDSNILNLDLTNDFLVYTVCNREIKKLDNLGVDAQANLFINLSTLSGGSVSLYDIKNLFPSDTIPNINDGVIEKLKGHPLLNCSDNKIYFRYDFFNEFFKSIFVSRYFRNRNLNEFSNILVEILASYVRFDNAFTNTICQRLNASDDLILFAIDTIAKINSTSNDSINPETDVDKRAISAIFSMLLSLLRFSKIPFNMESCTELLGQVFGAPGGYSNVYLINLAGSEVAKPVFNFKSKTITNSYFDNYEYFWDCQIDQCSVFENSVFRNLAPRKGVRIKFFENTFGQGCDIDDIKDLLNSINENTTQKEEKLRDQLVKLFKLFYQAGNFYARKQEHIKGKVFTGILLPTLIKKGVILDYIDSEKATMRQYKVSDGYRSIIKHIEQSSPCVELDRVVSFFSES